MKLLRKAATWASDNDSSGDPKHKEEPDASTPLPPSSAARQAESPQLSNPLVRASSCLELLSVPAGSVSSGADVKHRCWDGKQKREFRAIKD